MTTYACGLLVQDGKILLGFRAPHRRLYPNCWDVIGGKVEAEETVDQALVREFGEELGIVPERYQYVGDITDVVPSAGGRLTYAMYLVTAWSGGAPQIANDEHVRIAWFAPAEAAGLDSLAVEEYRALFRGLEGRI